MSPIPLHSHAPTPNSAPTFFFISSHTQVLCLSLYLCQMLVTARTYWMLSAKIWDKQLPWKILIVSSTSFTVGEAERWSNIPWSQLTSVRAGSNRSLSLETDLLSTGYTLYICFQIYLQLSPVLSLMKWPISTFVHGISPVDFLSSFSSITCKLLLL